MHSKRVHINYELYMKEMRLNEDQKKIVIKHMFIAEIYAKKFSRYFIGIYEFEDILQIGYIFLCQAVCRYDSNKCTIITNWIWYYIKYQFIVEKNKFNNVLKIIRYSDSLGNVSDQNIEHQIEKNTIHTILREKLTVQEFIIINYFLQGYTYKEMPAVCNFSYNKIRTIKKNIFKKLKFELKYVLKVK